MKKLILSLIVASVGVAGATSLQLSSAAAGPSVFNTTNTAVVATGLLRVGYLTTPGDVSTFVEYGTSSIGTAGAGPNLRTGKLNGGIGNNGPVGQTDSDDAQFNGKDIYVWIYNAATAATATQSGLFRAVGQVFPNNDLNSVDDFLNFASSSLSDYIADPKWNVPNGQQGRYDAAATSNLDPTIPGAGRFILGGIVPEPSSVGLLALAGLALTRRRR